MKGKDKCEILKEIRAQIAAANDIEWVTENCTHKGDCRGTCPKCEAEVAALEKALARRCALGKTVAVAGLSAGMIVSTALTTSCELMETQTTDGDMVAPDEYARTSKYEEKYVETGQIDATGPEVSVEIDGDMVDVTAGVPLPIYYYSDFLLQDARVYETEIDLYAYCVITDEETECGDGVTIPAGARFEVIGEMGDEIMWLIRYEDACYSIYGSDLHACALEVTEATPEVTE